LIFTFYEKKLLSIDKIYELLITTEIGDHMSDLIVLTSNKNQDKRKAVLALQKKFQDDGYKTAVLVTTNGRVDVYSYLMDQKYHYSIPLEATKSKEAFEQWVPVGYDKYILEITFPYSPIGAAYIDLFDNINDVVSNDHRDTWKQFVLDPKNKAASIDPSEHISDLSTTPDLTSMWDIVHNRHVQILITKCSKPVDDPYLDNTKRLHNLEKLAVESITPRMVLPVSDKKVIAFGEFPAEYWDVFPYLKWYAYAYEPFLQMLSSEKYDLAIIGTCSNENLKIKNKPKNRPIICYQPSLFQDMEKRHRTMSSVEDFLTVFSTIKGKPVGTYICDRNGAFSGYNNRLWINSNYESSEPLWKKDNIIFCNGWISPKILIQEKLLDGVNYPSGISTSLDVSKTIRSNDFSPDMGTMWIAAGLDVCYDYGQYINKTIMQFRIGSSDPEIAYCYENAIARILWSGNSAQFINQASNFYVIDEYCGSPGECTGINPIPPQYYNKPLYYVYIEGKDANGNVFYHAVTAELTGTDPTNFNNYRFRQYDNENIQIGVADTSGPNAGLIQIPKGYGSQDTSVYIREVTNISINESPPSIRVSSYNSLATFTVDSTGSPTYHDPI
jgi:hypothetical protein